MLLPHSAFCSYHYVSMWSYLSFSHVLSGDLHQLRPPLSASVEKESFQQYLVVSHCTCCVSYLLMMEVTIRIVFAPQIWSSLMFQNIVGLYSGSS